MSTETDYIAEYDMIGISGNWAFIRHYMTRKYPNYYTDPYGAELTGPGPVEGPANESNG